MATNPHLLVAMPYLPVCLFLWVSMLEFDTTDNRFRDDLPIESLDIQGQATAHDGLVAVPFDLGLGACRPTANSSAATR